MKKYGFMILLWAIGSWADEILPTNSVYQIKSEWTTQDQKKVQLKSFQGKPVLIGMVYTGCKHACPLTLSRIQEIEKKIRAKGLKDFHFILASFDTKKDTPRNLKKYMKKRGLDFSTWTFLYSPDDETVRELAIVLGINYKRLDDEDFSHSNVLTLLDPHGVAVERLEGLNSEPDALITKAVQYHGK